MAMHYIFIFFLFLSSFCKPDDQLTHTKPLTHGDMLISKRGDFALGFFSPMSSNKSFYLGIWYHGLPGPRNIVWVANQDNPITNPSSVMLTITNNSLMVLPESGGRNIWMASTNIGTQLGELCPPVIRGHRHMAELRPSNRYHSSKHEGLVSYKGHVVARLVAWKGPDDPSSGDFSCSGDPSSPDIQLVTWKKTKPYCRIRVWNGLSVSGGTYLSNGSSILYQTVVYSRDEFYSMSTVSENSTFMRITLDYTGKLKSLTWDNHSSSWALMDERPAAACDLYASCGPFSYCDNTQISTACQCLEGFEPVDSNNFSKGCQRKQELKCGKQSRFVPLPGMMVSDKFLRIHNRSFNECAAECNRNCSCMAYAYANLSRASVMEDPSRCLVWSGELTDIGKTTTGEDLYIRLVSSVDKKISPVKIALPIMACMLLVTCPALVWMYKYRGKWRKMEKQKKLMRGYFSKSNRLEGENIEFPFVSYEEILSATNCFADANLLGRGGFGKVYKGTLEGGREVAVKRLSKGSGQGTMEFKNEVVLIAKLQHKNLVRLLGCCIHEDEKLLIYEYLPHKSLDTYIFDGARKHVLD